jgi:ribokinase
MKRSYTVFLGDVALDEYYKAPYFPKLKEKLVVEAMPAQMGGMIANAACVYAAYGNKTKFFSVLNSGSITKILCENLNNSNVETDLVLYDDSLADSKCLIFLAEGEHTVFIQDLGITTIEVPERTQDVLCSAEIIYSNYVELKHLRCGNLDSSGVLEQWQHSGVKLVCDIDVAELDDEMKAFFKYTDTLFMNEIGFKNQMNGLTTEETVKYILNSGVRVLVVTLAENGCIIYERNRTTVIPGIEVEVVDVTGAGDTFCSTFTHLIGLTDDVKLSGTFANYAAALSVTKLGARSGAVGCLPVLEFMKSQGCDTTIFEKILSEEQK